MPNGEEYLSSRQVIVEKASREDAGLYQCVDKTSHVMEYSEILVDILCKWEKFNRL